MSVKDHLLIAGQLLAGTGSEFTVIDPASGEAHGVEALESLTTARHVHWNLALEVKPWWFGTQ